jgi:hypothetical protein
MAGETAEEPTNPYATPKTDGEMPWGLGDPRAEEARRAHIEEESYLKAVGIANYLYVFWFGASACYYLGMMVLHVIGRLSAPWILRPDWLVVEANLAILTGAALVAGLGLRRMKPMALRAEALVVLSMIISWLLSFFMSSRPMSGLAFVAVLCLQAGIAMPMLNVWDSRYSTVLGSDYAQVIKVTPHIRPRAKLPLEIKAIMAVLLAASVILLLLSGALSKT